MPAEKLGVIYIAQTPDSGVQNEAFFLSCMHEGRTESHEQQFFVK